MLSKASASKTNYLDPFSSTIQHSTWYYLNLFMFIQKIKTIKALKDQINWAKQVSTLLFKIYHNIN